MVTIFFITDIFNRNESTPAREDRDADLDKPIYNQSTTCLPDKATNHSMAYNSTGVLTNDNSNFSSVETLLLNIQGLLKVAVENARHRENQINCEKGEYIKKNSEHLHSGYVFTPTATSGLADLTVYSHISST